MDDQSIDNDVTMRGSGAAGVLGVIDQYEILRELGGGGFGTVYLARDTVAGIDVAVKGLPPVVKNNKEELERIRENFALVSRLHHPNIAAALVLHPAQRVSYNDVRVRDNLRVKSGDTLMVMEHAPGVTLSQWIKQFPNRIAPLEQAVAITRQIAEGLDYAHLKRILHRDIKPSNIMIETSSEGEMTVRLLDFGLAAEIKSSVGRVSREVHDTSGTRRYMAPEQWAGEKQGPAADQYALAVVFCELVTGEVPFASVFECGDPVIMMTVVCNREIKLPNECPFQKALMKALAKNPDMRFASCREFASSLSQGDNCTGTDSKRMGQDSRTRYDAEVRRLAVLNDVAKVDRSIREQLCHFSSGKEQKEYDQILCGVNPDKLSVAELNKLLLTIGNFRYNLLRRSHTIRQRDMRLNRIDELVLLVRSWDDMLRTKYGASKLSSRLSELEGIRSAIGTMDTCNELDEAQKKAEDIVEESLREIKRDERREQIRDRIDSHLSDVQNREALFQQRTGMQDEILVDCVEKLQKIRSELSFADDTILEDISIKTGQYHLQALERIGELEGMTNESEPRCSDVEAGADRAQLDSVERHPEGGARFWKLVHLMFYVGSGIIILVIALVASLSVAGVSAHIVAGIGNLGVIGFGAILLGGVLYIVGCIWDGFASDIAVKSKK